MRKILLLILIICATVYCQTPHMITIDDFSYGLNTTQKGYNGILGYGSAVKNIDLTTYPTSFTVRSGYDSVFSVPGIDSFLWNGIHAINFRDGTKKLAIVGDSSGVGYANVYLTDENTVDLGVSDSIWLYPDTISFPEGDTTNPDPYKMTIYMRVSGYVGYKLLTTSKVTQFTRAEVVDSFVTIINADADFSPKVTAIDLGDTLLIIEDSADINVNFLFPNTYPSCLSTPAGDWSAFRVAKTKSYQVTTGNRIHTRFPATGELWWSQFKGVTYLGTGTGKAISYDGRTVNTFPMSAPGEPNIIPLTTSGNLDGTYRYALKPAYVDSVADTLQRPTFSYLSQPVIVDSQQIMLWDFPLPTRDYYYQGVDTISYEIWRSVGNIGVLDRADTLFYTGITISFSDSNKYADTTVIDTASDETIRANSSQVYVDGKFYNWQSGRIDTLLNKHHAKLGAPSIISWRDASGNMGMWGANESADASNDTIPWGQAAGWSYMCVYVDSNLNSPSDSGRSFNYYQGLGYRASDENPQHSVADIYYNDSTNIITAAGDTFTLGFSRKNTKVIQIALPKTNNANNVFLYRGAIQPARFDTSKILRNELYTGNDGNRWYEVKRNVISSDSFFVLYYYLIGSFTPGDTVTDSLCYDSLLSRELFVRNATPPIMKQMISYGNRLFAHDGQYIYESEPSSDSVSFELFSRNPVNVDDGDEITTMIPQFGTIKVMKNKSSYILTQNSQGYWRDLEASKYYGSVSMFSHIPAPEGDYFLSRDGFRLENENIYRSNSNIGSLMSNQLNNFTNMTSAQQRKCFGTLLDNNKAVLSFPGLDSAYVLNKVALPDGSYRYGWSIWTNLVMSGATQYDVRSDNFIYPGDTTYFIKSGSNGIYRYGTSTTDNGADIQYIWASHQLTELFDGWKQISRLYVEAESSDTVDSSHFVGFYDERKLSISPLTKYLPRLDTSYTYMYEMPDAVNRKSWRVFIAKYPFVTGSGSTIFNRLLIEYTLNGEIPVR